MNRYLVAVIVICLLFSAAIIKRERERVSLERRCPRTPIVAPTCVHDGVIEVLWPGQGFEFSVPVGKRA